MKCLKLYNPPEAEVISFATLESLCYDDSWARGVSEASETSDNFGGIELPDDNFGQGFGDGGIELPDDPLG